MALRFRELHARNDAAVNKNSLYRPMIPAFSFWFFLQFLTGLNLNFGRNRFFFTEETPPCRLSV